MFPASFSLVSEKSQKGCDDVGRCVEDRRRRASDPRLTDADRKILDRITTGDLADQFQAALDAQLVADLLLGG